MNEQLLTWFLALAHNPWIGLLPVTAAVVAFSGAAWTVYRAMTTVEILVLFPAVIHKGGSPSCWATQNIYTADHNPVSYHFRLKESAVFWLVYDGTDHLVGYVTTKQPPAGTRWFRFHMSRGYPDNTPIVDGRPYQLNLVSSNVPAEIGLRYEYRVLTRDWRKPGGE